MMGKLLIIRVKERGVKGDKCYEYKNEINLNDPNMLSIILRDLMQVYNAPVEKAVKMALNKNDESFFPFLSK